MVKHRYLGNIWFGVMIINWHFYYSCLSGNFHVNAYHLTSDIFWWANITYENERYKTLLQEQQLHFYCHAPIWRWKNIFQNSFFRCKKTQKKMFQWKSIFFKRKKNSGMHCIGDEHKTKADGRVFFVLLRYLGLKAIPFVW